MALSVAFVGNAVRELQQAGDPGDVRRGLPRLPIFLADLTGYHPTRPVAGGAGGPGGASTSPVGSGVRDAPAASVAPRGPRSRAEDTAPQPRIPRRCRRRSRGPSWEASGRPDRRRRRRHLHEGRGVRRDRRGRGAERAAHHPRRGIGVADGVVAAVEAVAAEVDARGLGPIAARRALDHPGRQLPAGGRHRHASVSLGHRPAPGRCAGARPHEGRGRSGRPGPRSARPCTVRRDRRNGGSCGGARGRARRLVAEGAQAIVVSESFGVEDARREQAVLEAAPRRSACPHVPATR